MCASYFPYGTDEARIDRYFGSVIDTMITLFLSITGGLDWGEAVEPLRGSVMYGVWILYIVMSQFAVLNVVTSVFVESVLASAKSDKKLLMEANARQLFQSLPGGL